MAELNLDHPSLPLVKAAFVNRQLYATEFRGQTTLVASKADLHDVLRFLHDDERCRYDFLSDIMGADYLDYPENKLPGPAGRFAVIYNLLSTRDNRRLFVKVLLDPSGDTRVATDDPELHLPTVTDIWPGAEWLEREAFDMFGIHFDGHPDLRRILLWESYPAFPLRKDYPVKGQQEREMFRVVERHDA